MCIGEPQQIVAFDPALPELAYVERAGTQVPVNLGLLDPGDVTTGDWVLVHIGFAVRRLEDDEARQTLDLMRGLVESHPDDALLSWGGVD